MRTPLLAAASLVALALAAAAPASAETAPRSVGADPRIKQYTYVKDNRIGQVGKQTREQPLQCSLLSHGCCGLVEQRKGARLWSRNAQLRQDSFLAVLRWWLRWRRPRRGELSVRQAEEAPSYRLGLLGQPLVALQQGPRAPL